MSDTESSERGDRRGEILAALGTATADLINEIVQELQPSARQRVASALGSDLGQIIVQLRTRPYQVLVGIRWTDRTQPVLPLATIVMPGDAPMPFSSN